MNIRGVQFSTHTQTDTEVEIHGQLIGINSLLLPRGFQWSNSGHQDWPQASFPARTHQPPTFFGNFLPHGPFSLVPGKSQDASHLNSCPSGPGALIILPVARHRTLTLSPCLLLSLCLVFLNGFICRQSSSLPSAVCLKYFHQTLCLCS